MSMITLQWYILNVFSVCSVMWWKTPLKTFLIIFSSSASENRCFFAQIGILSFYSFHSVPSTFSTGDYNMLLLLLLFLFLFFVFVFVFTDYSVIASVNITGGTITHRTVHFLFESFSTNMLIQTSEDLAGGSDNIGCSEYISRNTFGC